MRVSDRPTVLTHDEWTRVCNDYVAFRETCIFHNLEVLQLSAQFKPSTILSQSLRDRLDATASPMKPKAQLKVKKGRTNVNR